MQKKGEIIVVGLGPGAVEHISLETLAVMENADEVLLRTGVHPSVVALASYSIKYSLLDDCYENDDFTKVYETIVDILLEKAQGKNIVYAVPGSPQVAEKTVVLLRQKAPFKGIKLKILPALSFLDVFFSSMAVDPVGGLSIVDALDPEALACTGNLPLLITQVYNRQVASDVKLSLMDRYPDEYKIFFLRNLGMQEEEIKKIPLFELDRQAQIDHLTSIYIPRSDKNMDVTPLVDTLARLRAPDGCPWDKEQTAKSLREYLIEEVYEVIDAIDKENTQELCDELGDLLLQIVFHACLSEEKGDFSMQDVVENVVKKMCRRHPHVFGTIQVNSSDEVIANWEKIKKTEYKERKKIFDGMPKGLPALSTANKLQSKAGKVGFDWPNIEGIWGKVEEEICELKEAIAGKTVYDIEHELGDVLFTFVNLARHVRCHPELALNAANSRFSKRFAYVEECVEKSRKEWQDFSLAELDEFWHQGKKYLAEHKK